MRILPSCTSFERERHHRPADVDLAGHGLGVGAGHAAGRDRLGLGAGLLEQRQQDQVRRRAGRRERDGLAVGVLEALDRAVGLDPPEQLVGAGHLGPDDPVRRGVAALHVGADGAEDAVRHGDVDAAGGDGGDGLRAAFGVEHLDFEAGLLEEAGGLAELDPGAVPESLLRDRDLELLHREARAGARDQDGERGQNRFSSSHSSLGIRLSCRRWPDTALPPHRTQLPMAAALIGRNAALHNRGTLLAGRNLRCVCRPRSIAVVLCSAASVTRRYTPSRTRRSSWPIRRSA